MIDCCTSDLTSNWSSTFLTGSKVCMPSLATGLTTSLGNPLTSGSILRNLSKLTLNLPSTLSIISITSKPVLVLNPIGYMFLPSSWWSLGTFLSPLASIETSPNQ